MTMLRTASPHSPFGRSFRDGADAMLQSLSCAEASVGRDPYGTLVDLHDIPGTTSPLMVVTLPMSGHPNGWTRIAITFTLDRIEGSPVAHWDDVRPTAEIVAVARAAVEELPDDGATPAPDDADIVVEGLAFSLLDPHPESRALVRRATPWSGACILLGTQDAASGRFLWKRHAPASFAQTRALAAMRPGTHVTPDGEDARLGPGEFRVSHVSHDPVARLRAIAAWADFERNAS